jgi:hypothetical protein
MSGSRPNMSAEHFSAALFDDCFEHNLLTISPIDLILLPLAL